MNVDHPFTYLSLFTGGGGLDLGLHRVLRNARCVAGVEREAFALACLEARIQEGCMAPFPLHTDVASFSGFKFRGLVDAVIGGSPCQGMSLAGNRLGLVHDARSALFFEMVRIIEEAQPGWILWENVKGAKKYLPAVCAEFERVGYTGKVTLVRASDVGGTHERARYFILARRVVVAHAEHDGRLRNGSGGSGGPQGRRALGEVERRGLDVADAASLGWNERGPTTTTPRSPSVDGAGPLEDVAHGGGGAVGFEPGGSSWPGWPRSPVPRLAGEALADDDDERRESERRAGVLVGGASQRHDADGRGCEELADAGGLGLGPHERDVRAGQSDDGRGSEELADASDPRLQGGEWGGASGEGTGASRSVAERGRDGGYQTARDPFDDPEREGCPDAPPGPEGDWSGIPARFFPSKSRVRGVVDGLADGLDPAVAAEATRQTLELEAELRAQDCWADRLRMLGNGVHPKQAEAAIRFLYAAITRSTGE